MMKTIAETRDALRAGKTTATELAEASLAAINAAKPLNLMTHLDEDATHAAAAKADQRLAAGDAPDLCGIPIGIADMFAVKGQPLGAASPILQGFRPPYESSVTQRLADSGAVLTGRINQDEFGIGDATHGPGGNPWGDELTAGPDGGGAALAAGLGLGAIGSDIGGAVRQGAALNGMVGLRPTYGRISRHGMIAVASSLDQAGIVTRNLQDAAILFSALAGHDARDPTSATREVPDCEAGLTNPVKGLRIGIPQEYRLADLSDDAAKAWDEAAEHLRALGAELVEISLPHTQYALPVHYAIEAAEASSNLARYDGVRYGYRASLGKTDTIAEMYAKSRAEGFGAEIQHRLLFGTHLLSAEAYEDRYQRARRIRRLIRQDFDGAYADGIHAILTPAMPGAASKTAGAESRLSSQVMQVAANLAGLPAVVQPAGLDGKGLPLGVQLIGQPWDEARLLAIAHGLETAIGFKAEPKNWWQTEVKSA